MGKTRKRNNGRSGKGKRKRVSSTEAMQESKESISEQLAPGFLKGLIISAGMLFISSECIKMFTDASDAGKTVVTTEARIILGIAAANAVVMLIGMVAAGERKKSRVLNKILSVLADMFDNATLHEAAFAIIFMELGMYLFTGVFLVDCGWGTTGNIACTIMGIAMFGLCGMCVKNVCSSRNDEKIQRNIPKSVR